MFDSPSAHCKMLLSVDKRWIIGSEESSHFKEEATLGKYCAALDELECLVVMRLFELSKLSLSGTGLDKALQQHSDTICNAINHYNIAWKHIVDYSFLGEFDLLHNSHTDIQSHDWAKPAHHKATTKYFKLFQAHEEITQLNVEVCCLHTAIHDETAETSFVINNLLVSDSLLAAELKSQWHS
ncbi:uncharacterized protein EDB93DRAFT_1241327 [Suillus bovinus]|uniref:uncharacterized protein n=1 Tax=Suillus bovinus TaxID=48563 RepID=UPI001B881309|nr:uncharacterized protein EDB93DRAFT_1241327 [Suillus bovinus]KAG2144174.1 hypothetical protein EDB93DRAFT_1241327 [Suillus bovinus]